MRSGWCRAKRVALAEMHTAEVGGKILERQAIQRTLTDLAKNCRGDQQPKHTVMEGAVR